MKLAGLDNFWGLSSDLHWGGGVAWSRMEREGWFATHSYSHKQVEGQNKGKTQMAFDKLPKGGFQQWSGKNTTFGIEMDQGCRNTALCSARDGPVYFFFFYYYYYFLQYCSGFCHTLTWISHGFTCAPHPDPPSCLPLHSIPLGLPSAPALSTCLMNPAWAGDLFHPW